MFQLGQSEAAGVEELGDNPSSAPASEPTSEEMNGLRPGFVRESADNHTRKEQISYKAFSLVLGDIRGSC